MADIQRDFKLTGVVCVSIYNFHSRMRPFISWPDVVIHLVGPSEELNEVCKSINELLLSDEE